MIKEYDNITAKHYRAFRPPLHEIILKRSVTKKEKYSRGLDIGCGTGHSSIALTDFCNTVVGIEPSAPMLSKAIVYPKVTYSFFDKNHIDFEDNTFDIIALAGSLWYAKSQQLLDEIMRVGKNEAMVVIYDFNVLLETILSQLDYYPKEPDNPYNHLEDFSGLNTDEITMVEKSSEKVSIQIVIRDLVHLVLSVKDWYTSLKDLYGAKNLYEALVEKLDATTDSYFHDIQADTFFTLYRLK